MEYISMREATHLLGFKNNRSVAELIKHGYLRSYPVGSNKRELLKKEEVLALPEKDKPPLTLA